MAAARTRTDLTEVELIRLGHLVEDHAGTYFGGPLGFTRYDTIRYTSEAVVEKAFLDVTYDTLTAAIKTAIGADPTILDRRLTDDDRRKNADRRRQAAAVRIGWAHHAFDTDTLPDVAEGVDLDPLVFAASCIDAAEREDPTDPKHAAIRDIIAGRWLEKQVARVTAAAMRVTHAGSKQAALQLVDEAAREFPGAGWGRLRHRIDVYPASPEGDD